MIQEGQVRGVLGTVVDREGGGPDGWERRVALFVNLLVQWNQRINLVSRTTVDQVLTAHVLPSLAPLPLVAPDRDLRVLDIGSGGGFPGIPLRILRPRVRLDLVEATRKKCLFLEQCVAELNLEGTAVHWCRIETPVPELRARAPFDLAFARAVGGEPGVVRGVRGLLRSTGEAWTFVAPLSAGAEHVWADPNGRMITALRRLV